MTKEEAIRILKNFSLCGVYHQLIHMNDTDSEAISMAIKALEQPEPQWIPCSERSPDEDGDYLVTIKYHVMDKPICIKSSYANDLYEVDDFDFEDKKGKSGWYSYDSEYGYGEETNVIAWMPLPEPYKGDE